MRVGASWKGSNPESTVEVNDLLILKGSRRKISGRTLKGYNPNTKETKVLSESCRGELVIDAAQVFTYVQF